MAITANNSATVYATNSPSKYPWEFYVQFTETGVSDGATNTSTIDIYGYMYGKNINYSGYSNRHMYIYWFDNNEHSKGTLVDQKLNISSTTLNKKVELSGSITVKHKDDGTLSGYAKIFYDGSESSSSWAAPDTTVVTKDTALTKIARYLSISKFEEVAANRTEENIRVAWQTSNTCSSLVLYLNDVKYNTYTPNSTSGNIDVAVSPGSTNKIYIKCTRSDSGLTTDSSVLSLSSYKWPHVSKVINNSIVIGNNQQLELYNPRNLPVSVYMTVPNATSGTAVNVYTKNNITTNGTITLAGSEMNTTEMYKSIPNSQTGTATYYCQYSTKTIVTRPTGVYSCNPSDCIPDITGLNIKYKDNSSTVQSIMQDDQVLVQSHSQLAISFGKANAQNSATIKTYRVSFGGKTKDYSTSTDGAFVIPWSESVIQNGNTNLTITAIDTRGYQKESSPISVVIRPWSKPTVNVAAARQNDFEEETLLTVKSLHYSVLKNSAGIDKNISEKSIEYKYTNNETGEVSNSIAINDNSTISLQLDQDNSFTIAVTITDAFGSTYGSTTSVSINRGVPIAMVDGEKLGVGINCFPEGKGLYVDGDAKITNLIDVVTFKGRSFSGTSGTAGYVHICDITSNETYRNQSISMDVLQRGRLGTVTLNFSNNSTAGALAISSLQTTGKIEAYYTSTLQSDGVKTIISLYIKKTEGYDQIDITNVNKGQYMAGVNIGWKNILATSLPSGAISATDADLDKIYPKGSIYMSTQNISPASFLGGEWTPLKDRFLLGAGNSYAVNAKGGYKASQTHTHGIPALKGTAASEGGHQHTYYLPPNWSFKIGTGTKNTVLDEPGSGLTAGYSTAKDGAHTHAVTTNASTTGEFKVGTDGAAATATDGNMPPYLAVYMWERTG